MIVMVHLDTNIVMWLLGGHVKRFPARVRSYLRSDVLFISPMVAVELEYLHEIGRLKAPADQVLDDLSDKIGLRLSEAPFQQVARRAWSMTAAAITARSVHE